MKLATTQEHGSIVEPDLPMGGGGKMRPVYREATVEEYREEPNVIREMVEVPELESIHPDAPVDYSEGYQWGMSIDLNSCIGCNACVVACQAENNIPIVGKEQVLQGREMHWIRIDRYFDGDPKTSREAVHQPCRASSARSRRASRSARWRRPAQPGRAQRHGLQPLHRHAVLLEQLPVQGAAVQLLQLSQGRSRAA